MTLIETVDKTQRNIVIKIKSELMFQSQCIAVVDISISKFGINIVPTEVLARNQMPYPLLANKMNLLNWFICRGFIRRTHRNIFYTELALKHENRELYTPLILSLSTNSVSLCDKYWLNPIITTEFRMNGVLISFQRKTWESVDPFVNLHVPGVLEEYGLYDSFFVDKPDDISSQSLIWTTSGEQNKRWILENGEYYLEKKLYKKQFENELSTLNFFSCHNIMVPEFDYFIQSLTEPEIDYSCIYNIQTRQEGLHVIQKRCLTNSNSYLVSLMDFVQDDTDIVVPIQRMCSHYNVNNAIVRQFIDIVKEYQKQFNIKDTLLNTQNMGLLITNDRATPVVWGRLQLNKLSGFTPL